MNDPVAWRRRTPHITALAVLLLLGGACRQKMADQPRLEPFERTHIFDNGTVMRPHVEGTIAKAPENAGTGSMRSFVGVLRRGQQQFNIYCSPCHGRLGDGQGMIVRRGLRPPPSFHTARLREAPDSHFFDVISNGYGAMYAYSDRLHSDDRWATVAYLRALQLSQHAQAEHLPPDTVSVLLRRGD